MKKNQYLKYIHLFLIIWLILSFFTVPIYAEENVINNEITYNDDEQEEQVEQENTQTNERIQELEDKKGLIESQTELMNSELECISEEVTETVAEITELSQKIFDKQTEMEEVECKINLLNDEIAEINLQINDITEKYELQKKQLEKRLVAMYEMGNTSYLDVLLNSKGIVEFFSNYYYISVIANADKDLLNDVEEKKNNIEDTKKNLVEKENEIAEKQLQLKKDTISLSNLSNIKNQKLRNLNAEEIAMQQQIEEYQSQVQKIESEIKLLSLTTSGSDYVGGIFAWPVPGYTTITSQFGMRTHPITGIYKLHTGVDISAPINATFIASNSGVVIKAAYNTAYGNMVIIDHGGGITTLYAHGNEILVQERSGSNSRNACFESWLNRVFNWTTCSF